MNFQIDIYYTHQLVAEALKYMIDGQNDITVNKLSPFKLSLCPPLEHSSHVLLIEISFPNRAIVHTIKRLKAAGFKVIIVGLMMNNGIIEELINAKLDAYILKTCSENNLSLCLTEVLNNSKFYCYTITECLHKQLNKKLNKDPNELTQREQEVLKGLVNFKSTPQIANELNITTATVRTHRKNIMMKLGAKNYIALLRKACSLGLLAENTDQFCEGCVKLKCHSTHIG